MPEARKTKKLETRESRETAISVSGFSRFSLVLSIRKFRMSRLDEISGSFIPPPINIALVGAAISRPRAIDNRPYKKTRNVQSVFQ